MKKEGQLDGCVLAEEEEGKGEPASLGRQELVWQETLKDEAHGLHLLYDGARGTRAAQ